MLLCNRVKVVLFSILLAFGRALPARAQVSPPGEVTVIHPADNGYGDLINACAALNAGKAAAAAPSPATALDQAQNPGATLADKRAALRDPRVLNALALLRVALSKPRIERTVGSGPDPFPVLPRLREMARLLAIEEYVQLADGSTASAINTLGEALSLADVPQHWSVVGVMAGQTMIAINVKTISTHLDRLSAGDCSHLQSMLKIELDIPNPAIAGVHADTASATSVMKGFFSRMVGPPNADPNTVDSDGLTGAELRTVWSLHAENGDGWKAFQGNVVHQIEKQNDTMATQIAEYPKLPPDILEETQSGTGIDHIAAKFARALSLGDGYRAKILDSSVASRAQLQLLAVHAAIHRYRWEHNALPESLAVLKLGPLTNDPFVSELMGYERTKDGKSYTLSCAGPPMRDDDGQPVPGGKRQPLTLP